MLVVNAGVLKVLPVASRFVRAASAYHWIAPEPVALRDANVPEQIIVPDAVGAAGAAFTCAATGVRAEEQLPLFSET